LPAAQQLVAEARILEAAGDLDSAQERAERARALVPAWPVPRALLGRLHQIQGHEDEAKQEYKSHQLLSLLGQASAEAGPLLLKLAEAEGLMIFLINRERITRGLCALEPTVNLSNCARQHSAEMMQLRYFGHTSPVQPNATPIDRFVKVHGRRAQALAENLAYRNSNRYSFKLHNIAESHADLMNSPKHRDIILWDQVEQVGVGIAVNDNGDYWITEMFTRLR